MSSFLVSDEHITVLVNAARRFASYGSFSYYFGNPLHRFELKGNTEAQDLGNLLRETNIAGQVANYGDDDGAPAYTYPRNSHVFGRQATAVEALKALGCYEYQACEAPNWDTSEARTACESMRHTFISALPGYDAAPYEWSTIDASAR